MATAVDADLQVVVSGDLYGGGDVGGAGAAGDHRGASVDHGVPHPTGLVVICVSPYDDLDASVTQSHGGSLPLSIDCLLAHASQTSPRW